MTRNCLMLAAVLLGLANVAAAQEETPHPVGATPTFAFLSKVDLQAKTAVGTSTATKFVFEMITKTVADPDGTTREVVVTVCKPVLETRAQLLTLEEGRVFDATSAKLTAEQIAERAKVGAAVVVAPQGMKIAPVYRAALAPTTLILIAPPPPPIPPAAPGVNLPPGRAPVE